MDAGPVQTTDRADESRRWLARNARMVVRLLNAPPERWADPRFRREVEDIRRSLMPIQSRRALVASFTREGSLLSRHLGSSPAAEGRVPIAYAIRWHELGRPGRTAVRRHVPAA